MFYIFEDFIFLTATWGDEFWLPCILLLVGFDTTHAHGFTLLCVVISVCLTSLLGYVDRSNGLLSHEVCFSFEFLIREFADLPALKFWQRFVCTIESTETGCTVLRLCEDFFSQVSLFSAGNCTVNEGNLQLDMSFFIRFITFPFCFFLSPAGDVDNRGSCDANSWIKFPSLSSSASATESHKVVSMVTEVGIFSDCSVSDVSLPNGGIMKKTGSSPFMTSGFYKIHPIIECLNKYI